jgi:hypothetical protein
MKILVRVLTKQVNIEVGEGTQTVRWLAQVVSARIKMFKLLRSTFEDEKQLVTAIRGENGEPIDPNSQIVDVLNDGSIVIADVSDEIITDSYGQPSLPEWMMSAYVKSTAGQQFLSGYEAWKRNPTRMRTATAPTDVISDSLVFVGELTDVEIFASLELDWPLIEWNWCIDHMDESFMYKLKDIVRTHYGLICRLFNFLAGTARAGQRYGITMTDFKHLIHCSGLSNIFVTGRKIENIFNKAAGEIPDNGTALSRPVTSSGEQMNIPLLTRAEFVQGIARMVIGDISGMSNAAIENHILTSMEDVLKGSLYSYWEALAENMESYNDESVRMLLNRSEAYLKDIFHAYGSISKDGPIWVMATLKDVIYGCDIAEERLSFDQLIEDVFFEKCRVVMGASRGNESITPGRSTHPNKSSDDKIFEMTFSEFREALVRCILYANSKSDFTNFEKVQSGIERLMTINPRPHK